VVSAADDSYLGGDCDKGLCYSCGDPYADEAQEAPEAVYSFTCQQTGSVTMLITDLTCDLDIYVLDDSCDPNTGCLHGSTASFSTDDEVSFTCLPGETYYVVVEAYGTRHLDMASGPCTDDGTAKGTVYDPGYTLSFDVSASTGCAEDCDDGLDNDLDGDVDCDDTDCWTESDCCDTDLDGYLAEDCDGDDCDDSDPSVYPGAPEDGGDGSDKGDGIDNDCDGEIDEGTNAYDDDGDGYSEDEGDCDDEDPDVNPDAEDEPDNGIDEDCDGQDASTPDDTDPGGQDSDGDGQDSGAAPDPGGDTGTSKGGEQDDCGCSSSGIGALGLGLLWALVWAGLGRRRRGA